MKTKLYSFFLIAAFALVSTAVISQNISLSNGNGAIANGSSITITGLATDASLTAHVYVTNNFTDTLQVKLRKIIIDTVPGTTNDFCLGACFPSTVYVSPNPFPFLPGVTDQTAFVADYYPTGLTGTTTVRYLFYNINNLNDTATVTVNYSVPTSVNDYSKSISTSAYPNPANSNVTISYDINKSASEATLIIRNILGRTMKEIPLSSLSGRINVNIEDLDEGIYFYSIMVDNDLRNSKKLIIRH